MKLLKTLRGLQEAIRLNSLEGPETRASTSSHLSKNETSSLYEKLYSYWMLADWINLSQVEESAIQRETKRAEISQWVGIAHFQQQNPERAGHFLRLANQWGARVSDLNRLLAAVPYQSLGAAYDVQRKYADALSAYDKAISLGGSLGFLSEKIAGMPKECEANEGLCPPATENESLNDTCANLNQQIEKVKDQILKSLTFEIFKSCKQIQSFVAVQDYFRTGVLPAVSSELNMWPISPDLSLFLIQIIERENYDLIIEFGSGYSTELIARTLSILNARQQSKLKAMQFAFEHLPEFYNKSLQQLHHSKLSADVRLIHAPLAEWVAQDGSKYEYYDPNTLTKQLGNLKISPSQRILVLVDGPPGSTGPCARYPALPIINSVFPNNEIHYLVDDFVREDEKRVVALWLKDLQEYGKEFSVQEIKLEKEACLVKVSKK